MQQMQPQSRAIDVEQYGSEIQVVFSQVYLLMTLGLVVTAIVAAWVSVTPLTAAAHLLQLVGVHRVDGRADCAGHRPVRRDNPLIHRRGRGALSGLCGAARRFVVRHLALLHPGFDHA